MDLATSSVSNRRLRRGWMSQNDTGMLNGTLRGTLPPQPNNAPSEIQSRDPQSKNSVWNRMYLAPKLFLIQILLSLHLGYYGMRPSLPSPSSRFRMTVKWLVVSYLAFSLLTLRPLRDFNTLMSWAKSHSASSKLFRGADNPPLSTMSASLLFSKLAPQLDNLAHNAIQVILYAQNPSTEDIKPTITVCVWIPDSDLSALDSWISLPEFSSSVLITTSHAPGTPAYKQLIKEVRGVVKQSPRSQATIILISTSTYLSNLNTYINLARLFSKSSWLLLVPPDRKLAFPHDNLSKILTDVELRVQSLDSSLLFKYSKIERPQNKDGLLVPQDSPIWCSEHYTVSLAGKEWVECIRQFLAYHSGDKSGAQSLE